MVFQEQKSQKSSKDKRGSAEDKKEKCQRKAEKKQLKAMAKKGISKPKPDRPEMSLEDNVDEELPPLDAASEVVKFSSVEEMDDADAMRQAEVVTDNSLDQLDIKLQSDVKEMERVILEKNRRIEQLEAAEAKLQQEKEQLQERNLYLEQQAEGLHNRISVIGDKKRLRARTEQEFFSVIQHMDNNIKMTQAANANLKQRLEEALNSNKDLEASLQDLQKRLCQAADKKHVSAEEPKGAGKEEIGHPMEQACSVSFASIADWRKDAAEEATEVEKGVKFSIFEEMDDADAMRQAKELPRPPATSNGASEDWFTSFFMEMCCCGRRDT